MMLRKVPGARPSIERVKTQLERIEKENNTQSNLSTFTELQQIGQIDAEKKSREEAKAK